MDFLPSGGFAVSIQLVSPASGEEPIDLTGTGVSSTVSIQLVSPASGELHLSLVMWILFQFRVSIQLVSPASGELSKKGNHYYQVNVSIQLVSPASGEIFAMS